MPKKTRRRSKAEASATVPCERFGAVSTWKRPLPFRFGSCPFVLELLDICAILSAAALIRGLRLPEITALIS